ncbi:MAG: hypothetical protein ACPLRW_05600 [Moorellales bacterium]
MGGMPERFSERMAAELLAIPHTVKVYIAEKPTLRVGLLVLRNNAESRIAYHHYFGALYERSGIDVEYRISDREDEVRAFASAGAVAYVRKEERY